MTVLRNDSLELRRGMTHVRVGQVQDLLDEGLAIRVHEPWNVQPQAAPQQLGRRIVPAEHWLDLREVLPRNLEVGSDRRRQFGVARGHGGGSDVVQREMLPHFLNASRRLQARGAQQVVTSGPEQYAEGAADAQGPV